MGAPAYATGSRALWSSPADLTLLSSARRANRGTSLQFTGDLAPPWGGQPPTMRLDPAAGVITRFWVITPIQPPSMLARTYPCAVGHHPVGGRHGTQMWSPGCSLALLEQEPPRMQ